MNGKCVLIGRIATIVLLLIAVSAVLFASLVKCNELQCYVELNKIRFFPYTDFSENIIGALNISKGYIFGIDFSQPHFPGVYIFFGLIYKALGVSSLVAGNATASMLIYLAIAIMLAITYAYFTMVFGSNKAIVYMLAILLIGYPLSLYLPMSETLAFWLAIPLIYSNLRLIQSNNTKLTFLDLSAPVLITYFGVGFPGLIVLPFCLYALIVFKNRNRLPAVSTLFWVMLLYIFLAITLLMYVDISKLYFWTVDINVGDVKPALLSNIKDNILSTFKFRGVYEYTISIVFISCVIFSQYVKRRLNLHSVLYVTLLLLSMYWRISGSYKVLPALSIVIAIIIFCAGLIEVSKNKIRIALFTFSILIVGPFTYYGQLLDKINYSRHDAKADSFFLDNGICTASKEEHEGCFCIQTLVFGPQFYLYNDIKQCKYQINTWSSRMGLNEKYLEIVRSSIDAGSAAFYVPPQQYVDGDMPLQKIISIIKNKYVCLNRENGFELCKPKK